VAVSFIGGGNRSTQRKPRPVTIQRQNYLVKTKRASHMDINPFSVQ